MSVVSPARQPQRGPGPAVRGAVLQAGRVLRRWSRLRPVLINSLVLPVVLLLVVWLVFGRLVETTTGRPSVFGFVPMMICAGALFGGLGTSASMVVERSSGLFARFRSMPVHRGGALGGRVLAEAVRAVVVAVVVMAVGHLIGFRLTQGVLAALGILGVAALIGLGLGALFTFVGMVAPTPESTLALAPLSLLLMMLNSGFVPAERYPAFLEPVVVVAPLSVAVETIRALSEGGPLFPALPATVAWFGGLSVVFLGLAVWREHR